MLMASHQDLPLSKLQQTGAIKFRRSTDTHEIASLLKPMPNKATCENVPYLSPKERYQTHSHRVHAI
jgi:hypothetical protein